MIPQVFSWGWLTLRSGIALRPGTNINEAVNLLTLVGEFGEPESARKAAMNVLGLALQPPPRLPARQSEAGDERIYRILRRLTAEKTTHQKLVLEEASEARNGECLRRRDSNA